eukprot:NODE_845_length_3752_cov_0.184780.p1 type:complete len:545 gc:universal NODE_845_length_3752_cov_0.184780:1606-3240(+)
MENSTESVIVFDKDKITNLDEYDAQDILKLDEDVFRAIEMFNSNQFNKAINILQAKSEQDSIHAIALAFLLFMRAISTFNKDDIDKAIAALELSQNVAEQQNTAKSGFISKLLFKQDFNWISARSSTIYSEANILSAFLFIFQESISGLLKAGLYLTKGVRGIEELFRWYKSIPESSLSSSIDANTAGALLFVTGAMNVSTALLPPKVLKVISVFGYSCDIKLGFELMYQCENGNSIFSKIASLFILGIHSILLSFAPGTQLEVQCVEMQKRLDENLSQYPDSVFFLILSSRFLRSKRKLNEAAAILSRAIDVQDEWIGIKCLCKFELCMTLLFKGEYVKAQKMAETLLGETFWSKAFFCYLQGACADMDEDVIEKSNHYAESLSFITRKFGGKTIAIEQFVLKRVAWMERVGNDERKAILPALEIVYLFLGFSFLNLKELESGLALVTNKLSDYPKSNHLNLLKFALIRNINIIKKTYDLSCLKYIEEIENDEMDWIKPFSVFEQAQMHVDAYLITKSKIYLTRAKELLNQAGEFTGYILEFR